MTTEQQNRLIASLYRMMFLSKLINTECNEFLRYPVTSGIKNALKRMKDCYSNNLREIQGHMPNSKTEFEQYLNTSDEKIAAIGTILERLLVMSEEEVLRIESDFQIVSVSYE